jgi:hypothetical protein
MPGKDLKSCWAGRAEFLPLQPGDYLRRLCIVIGRFLSGYPWFSLCRPLGVIGKTSYVSEKVVFET